MNEKVEISIYSTTGDQFCFIVDGEKVFEQIKKAIKADKLVEISFKNINVFSTMFLNTVFGKLYGEFSEQKIKDSLSIVDINDDDKLLLKRIVENAKRYYKNQKEEEDANDKRT